MAAVTQALPWIIGGLLVALALFALRRPMGWLFRLAGRTGIGLAGLALFAPLGSLMGISLGINLSNALILGILGLPGFGLLLMLNWMFTVC